MSTNQHLTPVEKKDKQTQKNDNKEHTASPESLTQNGRCGGVKLISGTLHSALYQIFIHINIYCNFRHLFKKEKVENGVFAANCECCGHFIKFQVKSDVNSKITVTINGQKYTGTLN